MIDLISRSYPAMSFFRSGNDFSSSIEETSSDSSSEASSAHDHGLEKITTLSSDANDEKLALSLADVVVSDDREVHKDVILHTLLEDKCLAEALEELESMQKSTGRVSLSAPLTFWFLRNLYVHRHLWLESRTTSL